MGRWLSDHRALEQAFAIIWKSGRILERIPPVPPVPPYLKLRIFYKHNKLTIRTSPEVLTVTVETTLWCMEQKR